MAGLVEFARLLDQRRQACSCTNHDTQGQVRICFLVAIPLILYLTISKRPAADKLSARTFLHRIHLSTPARLRFLPSLSQPPLHASTRGLRPVGKHSLWRRPDLEDRESEEWKLSVVPSGLDNALVDDGIRCEVREE